MLPIETILHPTDFSPASEGAFRLAGSLARDHNARLIVLHVVPPIRAFGDIVPPIETTDYKAKVWAEVRALGEADPRFREVRVETELEEGDPAATILQVAERTGCDLIVMGTHGRTGLRRLLMGSVAEEVLRLAPCPVLTVKAPVPSRVPAAVAAGEEGEEVPGVP